MSRQYVTDKFPTGRAGRVRRHLSLYDGRRFLGSVQLIGERWRATSATGHVVGEFATQLAAASALYDTESVA
jgi:hypothetical protein